jgi:hypothetical protein
VSSYQQQQQAAADTRVVRQCHLSLVDLAGSERWDALGAQRLQSASKHEHKDEMSKINRSLTTLGRVVAMLAQGHHSGKKNKVKKTNQSLSHYLKYALSQCWLRAITQVKKIR